MKLNIINIRKSINKAFLKVKPNRTQIENFKKNILNLYDQINESESEEYNKNIISKFLSDTYYSPDHYINTKGRTDLVIHNGKDSSSTVGVLIETKKPSNKSEMPTKDNLNAKALQELILYYLRERILGKNIEVKHLIVTNIYEWFIFNANDFDRLFAQNKKLIKHFTDFVEGRLADTKTDFFFKQIAEPFLNDLDSEISFIYIDIRNYEKIIKNNDKLDDNKLVALFKLFSPENLLKLPFANDSNSLDKGFYSELLHLIGLNETKEGSKKLIGRKAEKERNAGSLIENTITILNYEDCLSQIKSSDYGTTKEEQLYNVALELVITWINRVIFLKLLEGQLIKYHSGDKSFKFLNIERIPDFDALNKLFFQVLAIKENERNDLVKQKFGDIPYLNSSLFEPNDLEHKTVRVSNLEDEYSLPILNSTILKDKTGKRQSGELKTLEYLFAFLDSYDFSSEGAEEIQEENKTLINASVLGLIFEKINGYKDGSFFTPGFITMYMCRETIRRAVLQKFNETKNWNCKSINDVYNKIDDIQEANKTINDLKICDPAVGSGHFLVSALNEIISIKNDLRILSDRGGKRLKEYHVEVVNDELVVTDEDGELFEYNPKNKESQRIQETLFHEKQTIIENCLFGVDINPNSVKICRLRLWIELLKNAYYKIGTEKLETLPNIDINIKCGNSLISRYPLDADIKKALRNSKWTIDSYRFAVMTYRNAQSKEEKRNMEKLIEEIKNDFESEIRREDKKLKELNKWKQQLLGLTSEQLFDIDESKKKLWNSKVSDLTKKIDKREKEFESIKNNIIFNNAFEWRFEFPEVLNNEGDFIGFDVVIGNPPWGASMSNEVLAHVKTYNKDIIVRMVDTFMFFINLDFTIKRNSGFIAQIIPDVLLYQIDNENLRKKILENYQLILAVNLGDNIFEDVARASCIVLIGSNQDNLTDVFEYRKRHNIEIEDINKTKLKTELFKSLPNTIFATRNIKGYSIISRYKESQLIELIDNDGIQRGISPDYKEAFIIDKTIIKQNNLENNFIFPTLTGGRDTERYYSKDIGKQIIYTKKGDDESSIENIIKYIKQFRNLITCKEVSQGKHPFWALHRARNPDIFNKNKKILGVITGDKISVSLDDNFIYPTDGLYVFSSSGIYSNEFLVGLLNSKLMTYLYRLISMEEDRALAQIKPSVLELIPVSKSFNIEIVSNIEDLTIKIINKVKNDVFSYSSETNEIDKLVYSLYDLSKEEIKIIEESVK